MSELFSWPTVTVGMRRPSDNGDPPAPGRGPGAGRFRVQVGTETTVALRAARRTRVTPGRVPWSAAGRPSAGHPFCPVVAAVPACARADPQTRGTGQGPYRCE